MQFFEANNVMNGSIATTSRETCGALLFRVMVPRNHENMHDIMFSRNLMTSISIKDTNSRENVVCSNIPLLAMMQFSQNRKGYWNFCFDENEPANGEGKYMGIIGIVALSEMGNVVLHAGQYLDIKINKIPSNAYVRIGTVDLAGNATNYIRYTQGIILGKDKHSVLNVQPSYRTILLPCGQTVDNDFNDPAGVDYPNPLDTIQLFFTDRGTSDMRLTKEDVRVQACLTSGNDLVAFWTKADRDSVVGIGSQPIIPPFMGMSTQGQPTGIYSSGFDYVCMDLEGVSKIHFYKNADGDYPFYVEKLSDL